MKRIIYIAQLCTLAFGLSACSDWFLDKEPQDERTDVVYFKKASQFKEYTAGFYGQLQGWGSPYGGYAAFMDVATDLSAYFGIHSDVGHGTICHPLLMSVGITATSKFVPLIFFLKGQEIIREIRRKSNSIWRKLIFSGHTTISSYFNFLVAFPLWRLRWM